MAVEYVKVFKEGITKEIKKKDLPTYVSLGWNEVKNVSNDVLKNKYTKMI